MHLLNAEVLHIRRLLADGNPDEGHAGMAQDLAALREALRGLHQEVKHGDGRGNGNSGNGRGNGNGNGLRRRHPLTLRVSLSLLGALSVSYALAVTQFRALLGDEPSHAIVLGVVILVAVVLLAATAQTE